MKALLLAAGLGTRLRPLTQTTPKCLVPIHGRPLLDYWLSMLCDAGVGPLLVNTHYLADQVEAFLLSHPENTRIRTVYENQLLGTAGTMLANRTFLGDEAFMLIHADNLSCFDVNAFISAHAQRPERCLVTMMTFKADVPQTCGIVELDGRGVVTAFHEKKEDPPGDLANGAVYIVEPAVFDVLDSTSGPVTDFSTQVLPLLMGQIYTFHNNCYHRDIGTMESYARALKEYT